MTDNRTTHEFGHCSYQVTPTEEDFAEIEQLIHDLHSYSLLEKMDKADIHELVRKELSATEVKDIVSIIVMAIIARKEAQDLRIKNIHLQWEISRLTRRTLPPEKDINNLNADEWTLDVDLDGTILAVDDWMVDHSWFSREELIGENMNIMSSWVHSEEFWRNFWSTIQSWKVWAGDICNKKKDGSLIWFWTLVIPKSDASGKLTNFEVMRQDVSKSYETLDKHIDHLTWLPNYKKCLDDCSVEKNRSVAILHINNMLEINSVFGRNIWDDIIKEIGKNLQWFSLEKNAAVFKFEGVDFGIVFHEDVSEQYILEQYEKLSELKILDKNKHIHLSFSLWIALGEPKIDCLLRYGYLALKKSKQARKPVVFDHKNHSMKESEDFFKIRNLVREACKEDLFEVFFQEIKENACATKKRRERKFECLVRMYDSKQKTNLIPPGKFLPVIKQDGGNQILTACVVEKVCKFMSMNEGRFSINLTEDDLKADGFARQIYKKIQRFSIQPDRIIFEILEAIENIESENIWINIRELRNFGFEIAIDDFWSGYSNFSRMLDFQPDYIKIDMHYIRWIDTNQKHRSLVRAIVGLAHDNGMMVVGEGVETEKEQLVLESLWVDYSQGYFFSRPSASI